MSFLQKFVSQFKLGGAETTTTTNDNNKQEEEQQQEQSSDVDSLCDAFYEKQQPQQQQNTKITITSPSQDEDVCKSIDSLTSINSCAGNCGCESDEKTENSKLGDVSSLPRKVNGGCYVGASIQSSLSTLASKHQTDLERRACGGGKSCEISTIEIPYQCDHAMNGIGCESEISFNHDDDTGSLDDDCPPSAQSMTSQECLDCQLKKHHKEQKKKNDKHELDMWNLESKMSGRYQKDNVSEDIGSCIQLIDDVVDDDIIPLSSDVNNISTCGTIDIALQFSLSDRRLQITVVEARDLPSKDRGGSSILQVRLVILPLKKKRFRTKVQHISSPKFSETFKLTRISPEDLQTFGVRIRLYGIGKMKDRLIGEASLRFDEINLIREPQLTLTLMLEPRADVNRSDMELLQGTEMDESNVKTLTHGGSMPELLISLAYMQMTGKLCVQVVKGSHFRNLAMSKPPDTFVKVVLLNSSFQEMAHSKTTLRKNQPNPVYKESFYFQVASFQLAEVSLMISVYISHALKRKEIFGWISMGKNSSSDFEDQHWKEMCDSPGGGAVSRWHTLIDT